jgi:hypothetical protein
MTTDEREGASLFSRAVQETLDTVVAPIVRDALIHDALTLGGLARLPTSRAAMRDFATGPLRAVTERALGAELAHSVADEILRVVPPGASRRTLSQARGGGRASVPPGRRSVTPAPPTRRTLVGPGTNPARTSPAPDVLQPVPAPVSRRTDRSAITTPPPGMVDARSWPAGPPSHARARSRTRQDSATDATSTPRLNTSPSPPRASGFVPRVPIVLVATEERALFETLAEWFSDRADVSVVFDAIDLVRKLDKANERRIIVIVDGKLPSIQPGALAVLLEAMPRVEVVLCRAAAATEEIVLSASPSTARWTVYREPASLDHVAAECVRLVS